MSSKTKKITQSKPVSKKVSKETPSKPTKKTIAKPKTEVEEKKVIPKVSSTDKEKLLLQARTKRATPSIFKARKHTPIVFSLADVQDLLKNKSQELANIEGLQKPATEKSVKKPAIQRVVTKKPVKEAYKEPASQPKRVLGAASLADILGFNPKDTKNKPRENIDAEKVPKHLLKYYKSLIDLREHLLEGLEMHSKETLKRSSKDDAGDLSSYGQHMADAGTDTFDRDFALNLLSSEQDALFEIEEAIQRIMSGKYGICEVTGTVISQERLEAVPFTRYGLEGQKQMEAMHRTNKERGSVFGESSLEDSAKYAEDFEE